ncbi:MAG TPA: efflux RND transporter periplasmic adaptor subunit [Flavobacteriaceae bacterium]|nr:efflux RND transporter periplasmic adaptor subunit [Flavobacteriaceae bacterium]
MKKYLYSFVFLTIALSLISCGNPQDQNAQMQGQQQATPVVTVKIHTDSATTYKRYSTRIEGIINSDARPKISGYITDVLVDEGEKVKKGQVLFRLETESLSEEASAAQANINAAQVQVNQLKPLVEKDIVSENQLATAQAKLSQAKASYQSIKANIGYATVRSPVDGFVGEIRKRRGNLVSPSDPKPLTVVTEISQVYAYFSMNEKDYLNFLKTAEGETRAEKIENMPEVTLVLANGDEYEHKGKIQTINSQIDKETGTVSFRAIFDNPNQLLTNGSTGQIKVPTYYENMPMVPRKSTFERQGRTYVMKVQQTDSSTVALLNEISVSRGEGNLYIIHSGAEGGDEIVAEGVDRLRSGQAIIPNEQPWDSVAKPVQPQFK